jgi:hypothetical protein
MDVANNLLEDPMIYFCVILFLRGLRSPTTDDSVFGSSGGIVMKPSDPLVS